MNATVLDLILLAAAIVTLLLVWRQQVTLRRLESRQDEAARTLASSLGDRHLSMLRDTNDALNSLGDRLVANTAERSDALRGTVEQQLQQTRDALVALQMSSHRSLAEMRQSQTDALSEHRDAQRRALGELRTELLEKSLAALGQQAQSQSESLRTSVQSLTQQLTATLETLTRSFDGRMGEIQAQRADTQINEIFRDQERHEVAAAIVRPAGRAENERLARHRHPLHRPARALEPLDPGLRGVLRRHDRAPGLQHAGLLLEDVEDIGVL